MPDLFLLSPAQMAKIEPFFPLSHGVPRVDDRRVISGIIYVLKHGLQWKDAPKDYGPHKTLYNRFRRWTELGVFDRIFSHLAASDGLPDTQMIDATHLKAHRTASSLIPDEANATMIADKGYDSDEYRAALKAKGIASCIPPRKGRKAPADFCKTKYKQRHKIENMFSRLKDWRRVATRYDRRADVFMAAIVIWWIQ